MAEHAWNTDAEGITRHLTQHIGFPCVVKPTREGSSIGVSVVQNPEDLPAALAVAWRWDTSALVEAYLDGMEFSVIVVGNHDPEALVPTEIVTTNPYMTYDDKYMPGRSQKITPAHVDHETLERIRQEARRAHQVLGFTGYSRIDGFLLKDGRMLITDPNSTSGMSPSSFLFHQAAEAGLSPADIIGRIVSLALEAHQARRGPLE
ncbi:MAG: ATP-grasp domain-containing protein [Chloroflexaceae bacterium]|nr:ATP-grasp domain-containing protein [Chloroflexaceae bacterium]